MLLTHCQDRILTENIWCVWSRTSYSGDKWRCYQCGTDGRTNDERRTWEDSATQPMDAGWLSFAIQYIVYISYLALLLVDSVTGCVKLGGVLRLVLGLALLLRHRVIHSLILRLAHILVPAQFCECTVL